MQRLHDRIEHLGLIDMREDLEAAPLATPKRIGIAGRSGRVTAAVAASEFAWKKLYAYTPIVTDETLSSEKRQHASASALPCITHQSPAPSPCMPMATSPTCAPRSKDVGHTYIGPDGGGAGDGDGGGAGDADGGDDVEALTKSAPATKYEPSEWVPFDAA